MLPGLVHTTAEPPSHKAPPKHWSACWRSQPAAPSPRRMDLVAFVGKLIIKGVDLLPGSFDIVAACGALPVSAPPTPAWPS